LSFRHRCEKEWDEMTHLATGAELFGIAAVLTLAATAKEPETVIGHEGVVAHEEPALEVRSLDRHDGPQYGVAQQALGWLGKFHRATVHFPIALLVAAAVAESLWMLSGRPTLKAGARYCLWFGGLTAPLAALMGWCFADAPHHDPDGWLIALHTWLGTLTALLAVAALVLGEISHRHDCPAIRHAFRGSLFLGAAVVLVTGFLGGSMVYGIEHFAW
jgi:uncharacterized membrane protein